jgi:hypothetical protein
MRASHVATGPVQCFTSPSGGPDGTLEEQWRQLDAGADVLSLAPDDEVLAELLALQSELIQQVGGAADGRVGSKAHVGAAAVAPQSTPLAHVGHAWPACWWLCGGRCGSLRSSKLHTFAMPWHLGTGVACGSGQAG